MKYIYNLSFLGILAVMCSACKTQIITPAIVPPVEIEAPQPAPTSHSLGIIGAVEPVYVLPMKMPFAGRIDTGAETSSIDASDIKTFERDGEKWVSFTIVNRETVGKDHRRAAHRAAETSASGFIASGFHDAGDHAFLQHSFS